MYALASLPSEKGKADVVTDTVFIPIRPVMLFIGISYWVMMCLVSGHLIHNAVMTIMVIGTLYIAPPINSLFFSGELGKASPSSSGCRSCSHLHSLVWMADTQLQLNAGWHLAWLARTPHAHGFYWGFGQQPHDQLDAVLVPGGERPDQSPHGSPSSCALPVDCPHLAFLAAAAQLELGDLHLVCPICSTSCFFLDSSSKARVKG